MPRWHPVLMQDTGGRAMRSVPLGAAQRRLHRLPHDRVQKPWRLIVGQHLDADQLCRQPRRPFHLQPGDPRRMTQLAAVAEHRQRLRQR